MTVEPIGWVTLIVGLLGLYLERSFMVYAFFASTLLGAAAALIVYDLGEKGKVGVLNLQGRVYMQALDCPFKRGEWAVAKMQELTKVIIVDMHAEATAEKMALGWHLDGRITALLGTHTHIQTADARILPRGSAYITDVGMTGPYDSVIGLKKDIAIRRFIHQTPYKYELASHDVRLSGVYIQADAETGKALKCESFVYPAF